MGVIRHAFRTIGRMPGLAAVVILSLGVGIGVNTAVFSWIQAIVLKPIPGVDNSGSFYHVEPEVRHGHLSWHCRGPSTATSSRSWQSIEELVAFRMAPLNIGEPGRTERTYAQLVSGNFFTALGLTPAAGRFIRRTRSTRPGAEPVVVLSHDYWQTHFAGSPIRDRPDDSRQRQPADDHRRGATELPGHDPRAAIRPVGAGDTRAGTVRRIEGARGTQSARILGARPPA